MGSKVIITEVHETSFVNDDFSEGTVHAMRLIEGYAGTLCGFSLIDEANKYEDTKKAVTCMYCIRELEAQEKYTKRNGRWY